MNELVSKAGVLLEALPYMQRFRGRIFVIKYGGSFMDSLDPAIRDGVARDIVFLSAAGIRPVVVHGGGKAITRALESAGLKASFIQGMRVTDEATVNVVEQVLSHEINPGIVAAIASFHGKARGFSGTDIFTCHRLQWDEPGGKKLDAGFVGEIDGVKTAPLLSCLEEGLTPVISPTARGEGGRIFNCNADVAAAQAAIALKASRLVFMSDVPGLLLDPKDETSIVRQLRPAQAAELKKSGVIDRGMIPKVDSALAAARGGVERVSMLDGRVPHALLLDIFENDPVGTQVTN